MTVLNNLRLRYKLVLMLLVPMLGLLFFSGVQVRDRSAAASELQRVEDLAALNAQLSGAVHELQRERGRSSLFAGAAGKSGGAELAEQRKVTDTALASTHRYVATFQADKYGPTFKSELDTVVQQLAGLSKHRQAVDALSIPAKDVTGYYTTTVNAILTVSGHIATVSSNADVARLVATNVAFSQSKEATGLERATLSNVFTRGSFDQGQFVQFVTLLSSQATYVKVFQASATPEQVAAFEQTVRGAPIDAVARMEQVALERATATGFEGVDASDWFNQMTAKIDLQKQVEDRLVSAVVTRARQLRADARSALVLAAAMGVVALAVALGCALVVAGSIARPLATMTRAANGLASGDLNQWVDIEREDEIGELAHAFRRMMGSIRFLMMRRDNEEKDDDLGVSQIAAS